jgi:hypothetical protein
MCVSLIGLCTRAGQGTEYSNGYIASRSNESIDEKVPAEIHPVAQPIDHSDRISVFFCLAGRLEYHRSVSRTESDRKCDILIHRLAWLTQLRKQRMFQNNMHMSTEILAFRILDSLIDGGAR